MNWLMVSTRIASIRLQWGLNVDAAEMASMVVVRGSKPSGTARPRSCGYKHQSRGSVRGGVVMVGGGLVMVGGGGMIVGGGTSILHACDNRIGLAGG